MEQNYDPCPVCAEGGEKVRLEVNKGSIGHRCRNGHVFMDSADLFMEISKARKLFPKIYDVADRGDAPEPQKTLLLDADSKQAMESLLGPFNGASELKALVFELKKEVDYLRTLSEEPEEAQVQAWKKSHPNDAMAVTMTFEIPESIESYLESMAEDYDTTVEAMLKEQFQYFLESNYTGGPVNA